MLDVFNLQPYPPLPEPRNENGARRKVGIEVEFGGLPEEDAARVLARATGGDVRKVEKGWAVETGTFGNCELYLDTKFRDEIERVGGEMGLAAARLVVPVELVSEPFDPAALPKFDAALAALREAGATGSREGLAKGFGVHLNIEIAAPTPEHVGRVARAYALLEPVLREEIGLDVSRRLLPFVDPYPEAVVDALTIDVAETMDDLAEIYLRNTASRNHGLDLLPVLAWAAGATVEKMVDANTKLSPRPAYHYRLPESRIDEEGWGVEADWRLWVAVEHVAEDETLLAALCRGWAAWRAEGASDSWADRARAILDDSPEKVPA